MKYTYNPNKIKSSFEDYYPKLIFIDSINSALGNVYLNVFYHEVGINNISLFYNTSFSSN